MKIVIFGSTGNIGKPLVLEALTLGYIVTAFTRDKKNLEDIRHRNLSVFEGDILDKEAVRKAVKDHDAVLCVIGSGRKGTVRSQGTRNIIEGMRNEGIKRLICQSTLGAGDSRDNLNFFWKHIMFGWYLKGAYKDHELQEKYVMESNLDWTLVRPGAFINGQATGDFRHGFAPNDRTVTLKISKADVAMFLLMQLNTDQYLKKTPGLSY
ncbi:NAD(P)-dependent oxidoreductase [Sinomicrobium sp. M5D2P17]